MSFRAGLAAALAFAAAGASVAVAQGGGAPVARRAQLAPPVIRESFTPLPCSGRPSARSTLQEEGCAEQRILATDAQINALAKSIFSLLADDAARRRFIAAHHAWLLYRHADCLSRSDLFEGGTLAGVIDAQCTADRNAQRVRDLRTFASDLRRHG